MKLSPAMKEQLSPVMGFSYSVTMEAPYPSLWIDFLELSDIPLDLKEKLLNSCSIACTVSFSRNNQSELLARLTLITSDGLQQTQIKPLIMKQVVYTILQLLVSLLDL